MTDLIIATAILLWYAFAVWAVKHEEELRGIYRSAQELVDRWLGEEEEEE